MEPTTIEFRFPNLHPLLEPEGTTHRINAIHRACALLSPMALRTFGVGLHCGPKTWDAATREDVVIVSGPPVALRRLSEQLAFEDAPLQLPGAEA